MTSTIAQVVLGAFIPLAIGLFFVMRPLTAALAVALCGDLFLPVGAFFHIPGLPYLDKQNLPYVCILVGCLFSCPKRVTKLPKEKWFVLVSLFAILSGIITGYNNGDTFPCGITGAVEAHAMSIRDGVAMGLLGFIQYCLTFYLGYTLVRGMEDIDKVLIAFGVAGIAYTPLAIYELRMSPQIHALVYGYGLGAFNQGVRWGGYRPTVFMPHGLALARFFMVATLALFVVAKTRRRILGVPTSLLFWFQALVLVLCKSVGAIVMTVAGVLLLALVKPRRQLLVASVLAVVTLLYPLLRTTQLFPVADFLNAAGSLEDERKESLAFRFANEDILLAHAAKRIGFGWGTYGRNLVCNDAGINITVTDGFWIIVLGQAGLAGFLISFGVLVLPSLLARRRLRDHGSGRQKRQLAGFTLILVLATVDLIPNGLWCLYPFFLAGALTRCLRELEPADLETQAHRPVP